MTDSVWTAYRSMKRNLTTEQREMVRALADTWNNGTREERQGISYIPVTLTTEEFDEFMESLTRPWMVHWFENGWEDAMETGDPSYIKRDREPLMEIL